MESQQCTACAWHFKDDTGIIKCAAYPNGIPHEILRGEVDHTKPYKGDHGLRFLGPSRPVRKKRRRLSRIIHS